MTKSQERLQWQYAADCAAMLTAAQQWKAAHPDHLVELKFNPFPIVRGGVMIGGLTATVIGCVAGNATTHELLQVLDAAAHYGGGATVLQAQAVIAQVFGIDGAVFGPPRGGHDA